MAITAPDNNPDVRPTPVRAQGSVWVLLAALAGLLVELLSSLPIPDAVRPYVPGITAILGWFAHQQWGPDEYHPTPGPTEPPTP